LLIKVWFSASTFVVKIATFAKRQTVHTDKPHILALSVFCRHTIPTLKKPQELKHPKAQTTTI
jgi:hypothetical protein